MFAYYLDLTRKESRRRMRPVRRHAKKFIFDVLYLSGITRFAAWWNHKRVMILCYHGITGQDDAHPNPRNLHRLHVNAHRFAAQLDYLQRRNRVISLREYLTARREQRPLPDYSVVLTVDDGYRNFLTVATPLLAARQMPATVYLITDRAHQPKCACQSRQADEVRTWTPSDDEQYLSWAEARKLMSAHPYIEFGSHSCSHPKLPTLEAGGAERELRDSRQALIEHLKTDALTFAYPYGEHSEALADRACAYGYSGALTIKPGANDSATHPFMLRRTVIYDDGYESIFAARVAGLTSWFDSARAVLRFAHAHRARSKHFLIQLIKA